MKEFSAHIPFVTTELTDQIEALLIDDSYERQFWHSIVYPHKLIYVYKDISVDDMNILKENFREACLLLPEREREWCTFHAED